MKLFALFSGVALLAMTSVLGYVLGFNNAFTYSMNQQASFASSQSRMFEHVAEIIRYGNIGDAIDFSIQAASGARIHSDASELDAERASIGWFLNDPEFYFYPEKYAYPEGATPQARCSSGLPDAVETQ